MEYVMSGRVAFARYKKTPTADFNGTFVISSLSPSLAGTIDAVRRALGSASVRTGVHPAIPYFSSRLRMVYLCEIKI
jgi:hypothetical protein